MMTGPEEDQQQKEDENKRIEEIGREEIGQEVIQKSQEGNSTKRILL